MDWIFTSPQIIYVGFEDIQLALTSVTNGTSKVFIINTLPQSQQDCLIAGTMPAEKEESTINKIIDDYDTNHCHIYIYGANSTDNTAMTKAQQLSKLGFKKIYIYTGGLFEWLLLQDIYGDQEFKTVGGTIGGTDVIDILKYKPHIVGRL